MLVLIVVGKYDFGFIVYFLLTITVLVKVKVKFWYFGIFFWPLKC